MCTNLELLREKMAEKKVSPEEMAKEIGVDASTIYRKFKNDGISFTIGQMHKIVDVLHLSREEAASIFLWQNSQKCEIL